MDTREAIAHADDMNNTLRAFKWDGTFDLFANEESSVKYGPSILALVRLGLVKYDTAGTYRLTRLGHAAWLMA